VQQESWLWLLWNPTGKKKARGIQDHATFFLAFTAAQRFF
jgi:hypothetical protein